MTFFAPNSQSYLYNHMTFFTDYQGKKEPSLCLNKGSIYDYIQSNPRFSKFKKIIDTAQRTGFLDSEQATCTVFVPDDKYLSHIPEGFFNTMDDGLARNIVAASTIPKIIEKDLLTSSPVCYLYTRNPAMRMYVTNISSQTRINNCATVVEYDIICNNGVIHLIDNLIVPNQDHFMN